MKKNFAIIGLGRIGKVHIQTIKNSHLAHLYCVFDLDKNTSERVANDYDCLCLDIDKIEENSNIDAVIICTPTDTHVELIERFSKTNKSIFCEKPIDLDVNRVIKCLQIVNQNNAKLMIGFNRRFDPHFSSLKSHIKNGSIGSIESLVITSRDPNPPPLDYIKKSGGIFKDMMIHDFDMAVYLTEELPSEIFSYGSVLIEKKIGKLGDFDTASSLLVTPSGKQIIINNSRRAEYGYDQRVEVHGSKGMISADNLRPISIEVANSKGFHKNKLHHFFMTRYLSAYSSEINHFIDCISNDKDPLPNGQDGLNALIIAEAAYQSSISNSNKKIEY